MRPHLYLLLILLAGCASPTPPNFILILTDDQGCGDVSFTGATELRTPNIEHLAQEGTYFSHFYVSPVCAPTRASLMTGRYHQRTGVRGVIEGREFMVAEEKTVAEHLQEAGYTTALFGKWHLGENYPWVPHAQGFEEYIGFRDGSGPYFDVTLDNKGEPYPTTGYLTDVLTDLAIDFIDRKKDQPFFLYLPYSAPHSPLQVPDSYLEPYQHLPEHTRLIYGMMASVDENVGRLLDTLDKHNLSDNTLVLFLSDNGPLYGGGGYEQTERFNCGLRGTKYEVYEGGIRVPLVARWPGQVPTGTTINIPGAHIDLLPTLLDYAGMPIPDDIDGRSIRPLLENPGTTPPARTLFMSYPREAPQHNTMPPPYPGGMATDGRYKMVNGEELYDLERDPGESINLAESHPDILQKLDTEYQNFWRAATEERAPYPPVHIGHPQENPTLLTTHWARLSNGPRFQFSDDPPRYRGLGVHGDRIAQWAAGGRATWDINVQAAGRYQIDASIACTTENAEKELIVEAGGTELRTQLSACSDPSTPWTLVNLGALELQNGTTQLTIRTPEEMPAFILQHLVAHRLNQDSLTQF